MTVGEAPQETPARVPADVPAVHGAAAAGTLLRLRLEQQLASLRGQEARVREDADSGIHKMRIAIRRLRSALATYRPVLAQHSTDGLRAELGWLGGELSPARDAQVMRQRLEQLVAEEPAELVMGPVAGRVAAEMSARYARGRRRALAALDSERYETLVRELEAFAADPPFTTPAGRASQEELPRLLEEDLKRVRRRADAVRGAQEAAERDVALHRTRKAAKRLRYAAESAAPELGKRAELLAERAKRIQELLGEHQDTVVLRQTLRELGVKASLENENGFTYGRLHAREQARAEALVERLPAELGRLPRGRLRRWFAG